MRKINVGIIGARRIGRVHAEHLAYRVPDANLVAVSEIYLESDEKLASDFQIPAVFEDHRRIMGAMMTSFPGDTTMATVEQVRAFASAKI